MKLNAEARGRLLPTLPPPPISRRGQFLAQLAARRHDDGADEAVIIGLKQWDKCFGGRRWTTSLAPARGPR